MGSKEKKKQEARKERGKEEREKESRMVLKDKKNNNAGVLGKEKGSMEKDERWKRRRKRNRKRGKMEEKRRRECQKR